MKCDDTKLAMMDLLYDEIESETEKLLRTHFAACEECRREYETLSRTSLTLQALPQAAPLRSLVFVEARPSWTQSLKNLLFPEHAPRWGRLAFGLSAAVVSALVTSAILNLEISAGGGQFSYRTSLMPRPVVEVSEQYKNQLAEQLRLENREMVAQLVQAHYQKQQAEFDRTLVNFATEFNRQRQQDILLLGQGLEKVEQNTVNRLQQTDRILDQLMLRVGNSSARP